MQLPLSTDEIHPPNPPSHPGSPHDSDGNCVRHPTVSLARPSDDGDGWIVSRKRCPKCCLDSIIRDTARKTDVTVVGRSRSVGWNSGASFRRGMSRSTESVSLSLPHSFVEGDGQARNGREIRNDDDDESSYYRRGDARGRDGPYRDPRDIPFRTAKDPSVTSSSSYSSRRHPSVRNGGRASVRNLSPQSEGSISGRSTIPSISINGDSSAASTCSTITVESSFRTNSGRRRRNNNNNGKRRAFSSSLDPVREGDCSRGRDPEEESKSRDGNPNNTIPTQVNIPQKQDENTIVLIANMPRDIGNEDRNGVMSVNSRRSETSNDDVVSSGINKDDPSLREDRDLKRHNSRDTRGSRRNNNYNRDERNRRSSPRSHGGDASSSFSQQTSIAASQSPSLQSRNSSDLNRIAIDPDGYCSRHPTVRLMKPDTRDNSYWCIVRKKCPACLREDRPSVFGDERSMRSNVTNGTEEERTLHSVEKTKGSSFFMPSMLTPEEIEEEEDTRRLKRRLAARAYHFPGNTWCEDWFQYISNTHTVLGLFFHHPLHPLKLQERLVILFGSIAIGLTISNLTYMHFIKIGIDIDEELFRVNLVWMGMSEIIITKLMITLWTLGSFLHTVFDLGLWHMKACTLCRYGGQIDDRMARWGRVIGLLIVTIAMAAGSYAVLLRASIEYKGEESEGSKIEEAIRNNEFYEIDIGGKRSFRFLLGYLVEFLLAMFVYYPLAVTVIFSGILGCRGRIPILGGRPREIKKERNYAMRKRKMLEAEAADEEDETSDVYADEYSDAYADEYSDAFPEDSNSASYYDEGELESRSFA